MRHYVSIMIEWGIRMAWVGGMNGVGDEAMDKVGDMGGDGLRNMVHILKR